MNERIKELDKQAYQWAVNESKGGTNICAPGSDYFLAMEKKKFAELIIQECIKKVELRKEFAIEDEHNVDEAFSLLVYDIEEYFGVE